MPLHRLHTITQSIITHIRSFFQKKYYNHRHIELTFQNGKFHFNWQHHSDYVVFKRVALERLKPTLTPEQFILAALEEAKHCNYIIFDCQDENRYLQFWFGDGGIIGYWSHIPKVNKLHKYLYPMLGVLNELKISQKLKKTEGFFNTHYQYYDFNQDHGFDQYKIHFANNFEDAAVFTILVFTKVFNQKLDKLRFNVG